MKERILGIDIGNQALKLVLTSGGKVQKAVCVNLPDNLIKENRIVSEEALGDFIKEAMKQNKCRARRAAIAVPSQVVYIRNTSVPMMTTKQLVVNLPYEFHDFINQEMDQYVYDYAVLGEGEDTLELLSVAASKELLAQYGTVCKRAGLKLEALIPDICAFRNLISQYEKRNQLTHGEQDYAILDMGNRSIKLHFFAKGEYEVTRNMQTGCIDAIRAYAEYTGREIHIAGTAIENGALDREMPEAVENVFSDIAVQIMRALNFYSFSNPNNNVDALYVCGGGSRLGRLLSDIAESTGLPLKQISELLPEKQRKDEIELGIQAFGITAE